MDYPIISADSHITEPPNTYVDYIDPRWREKAPRMERRGDTDLFVIDGMKRPVPMGLVAAAGKPAEELREGGVLFEDLHRGGWDSTARLQDQERDGVSAEVIYPTVGMLLCNHRDFDYKKACFDAYNRWIVEYCSTAPDRLIGQGQTAMRSPEEGVADLGGHQAAWAARRDDAGRSGSRGLRLSGLRLRSGGRPSSSSSRSPFTS